MVGIKRVPFNEADLLKYGDKLEISGMYLANGQEGELILFPEASLVPSTIIQPTHEEWKTLLYQLDTNGVMGLNKTILRKSQRNIEQTVSWNVFRRDNYTCQYCGKNDVPLTIDHIVRWENMGASVEENLISSCKKCNKTRGDTEFPQWLLGDYFLKAVEAFRKPLDILPGHMERLHHMYREALKVPLRQTQRNR